MKSSLDSVFYKVLLFTAGVSGFISNVPLNAVSEVGTEAILNCTSSTTLQHWVLTAKREDLGTSSAQDIALNCVVQPGYTTNYEVDRPGGSTNACNLIVKATTMQQAGVYTCSDSATGPSAVLTVIESSPNITYNTTTTVVENEIIINSCSLKHNGSVAPAPTLRPYFYWTDSNGQNVSSSYDSTTENEAVSQLTVTAGRQNIMAYTCHVYFQLMPPTSPGYASNTPIVNNNASSPTIEVLYAPSVLTISRISTNLTKCEVVCGISELTCHVTANPLPIYQWFDATNNVDSRLVSGNQKFAFAEDGRTYNCTAYNFIRGARKTVSSTNYVASISNSTPCKFPHSSAMEINAEGAFCEGQTCHCTEEQAVNLTCFVDAYPAPSYQWNSGVKILSEGASYVAVYNGIYTCISTSYVAIAATKDIMLIDCKALPEAETTENPAFDSCTEAPPQESLINTAVIVLSVILAASLLGHVATTLYLVLRKSKYNAKATRNSPTKTTTADDDGSSHRDMTDLEMKNSRPSAYEELRPVANREQPSVYTNLAADSHLCNDKEIEIVGAKVT